MSNQGFFSQSEHLELVKMQTMQQMSGSSFVNEAKGLHYQIAAVAFVFCFRKRSLFGFSLDRQIDRVALQNIHDPWRV